MPLDPSHIHPTELPTPLLDYAYVRNRVTVSKTGSACSGALLGILATGLAYGVCRFRNISNLHSYKIAALTGTVAFGVGCAGFAILDHFGKEISPFNIQCWEEWGAFSQIDSGQLCEPEFLAYLRNHNIDRVDAQDRDLVASCLERGNEMVQRSDALLRELPRFTGKDREKLIPLLSWMKDAIAAYAGAMRDLSRSEPTPTHSLQQMAIEVGRWACLYDLAQGRRVEFTTTTDLSVREFVALDIDDPQLRVWASNRSFP